MPCACPLPAMNLPTDLLRTFVTVVDRGGFTAAGEALGRSQPAVSLQIRRLEELVGVDLLTRGGRSPQLTDAGRTLCDYARQMLGLNDEVIARLRRRSVAGCVRLGVPNEFADSFLPDILGRFATSYPDVTLEVGCDLSTHLVAALARGRFDVVFGLHASPPAETGPSWREELVWVGSPQHQPQTRQPLPLIVAPEGCVYRRRILDTLGALHRPWRIAYTSPSFGGIKAGVLAGLGVTVLARSAVPDNLRVLGSAEHLPELAQIHVALHYTRQRADEAVLALVEFMAARLGPAETGSVRR